MSALGAKTHMRPPTAKGPKSKPLENKSQHIFNFETFNNLAHVHNVQGNVKASLQYLRKALEEAWNEPWQDDIFSPFGTQLVETYLNIANAEAFLNRMREANMVADQAIALAQEQIGKLRQVDNQDPRLVQA